MFTQSNEYTDLGLFLALHYDGIAVTEQDIQNARSNDNVTLYKIGGIYYGEEYYEKAFAWFLKAALQGYGAAQVRIGYMYELGQGESENSRQAMYWYLKASSSGNAEAQFRIGYMYYSGWNVPNDYKQALKWFLKAANNGNTDAMNYIGVMYYDGNYVTKNLHTAIEWYTKAANQGNEMAQCHLGNIYEQDEEVKDLQKAANWYQKAANNGDGRSKYKVIFLRNQGYYAKEDEEEAEKEENETIQGDLTNSSINNDQSQSSTESNNGHTFNMSVESRVDNLEKMFQSMMSLMKVNNSALQKELDALKQKERQQNEENKLLKERLARMEAEMQDNPNNDLNYDSPDNDDDID